MFGAVLCASVVSLSPFSLFGQQAQPIGDSIRRAVADAEKFYGRQWQLEADALRVALVEPGAKLRFRFSTTKETVSWYVAGQNNGSKLEMKVVDPSTGSVVEEMEQESRGDIYFMPMKSKSYSVEILNRGAKNDFVTVIQVVGGLGAALPLSKIKFIASSSGHALWESASAGDIEFPLNRPFLQATVVPARGTFTAPLSIDKANSQVIGFGEEDTLPIKTYVLDGAGRRLKTLEDDGSGARFADFSQGVANARIQLVNSTGKRLFYSWSTVTTK
jgi:hypothetical protein